MAQANPPDQVVLGEEIDRVRLITLNRPRQLNVISSEVVSLLAEFFEKWEKEDDVELVLIKVFSTPEASIGHHVDCSMSYILSRLPGHLGEFLALSGARLNGKELVAAGLASHFVPFDKMADLEKCLIDLNTGDAKAVKSSIEEFSVDVGPDEDSLLNKMAIINECFSKDSVSDIITSLEAEANKEGNGWIAPILKGLKRSSPTGLKINLRSIREARNQTLSECLKQEFRLTINILRATISADIYEGIRALTIDKDNAPKWDPSTLESVDDAKVVSLFKPFKEDLELKVPDNEGNRWDGKYENSPHATLPKCI